jgi:hemoglobin
MASVVVKVAIVSLALAACASQPPTLFDRAGGAATLKTGVLAFRDAVGRDPLIGKRFEGLTVPPGDDPLYVLICETADGPCRYDGPSMAQIHRGMEINEPELDRFLGILKTAFASRGVPAREQDEIVVRLRGLHDQVVGR